MNLVNKHSFKVSGNSGKAAQVTLGNRRGGLANLDDFVAECWLCEQQGITVLIADDLRDSNPPVLGRWCPGR